MPDVTLDDVVKAVTHLTLKVDRLSDRVRSLEGDVKGLLGREDELAPILAEERAAHPGPDVSDDETDTGDEEDA